MEIFYVLLLLLVVTRTLGELAVRVGQPALIGELVSGVLLGLLAHYGGDTLPFLAGITADRVFLAITDLGVFFLMLLAGIEMHPRELARGSKGALLVAVGGMLVPLALGCALGWAFMPPSPYRTAQILFIGTTLSVTAVPVSVRVLRDLGQLDTPVGRTIVSAALFDDALSLILLAVLTALIRTGGFPSLGELLLLGGQILLFFAITIAAGVWLLSRLGATVRRFVGEETELTTLVVVALAFAVLAEQLQMHFIVGAFVAGLFFSGRTFSPQVYEDLKRKLSGLTSGFLAPVFFASIGLHLQPEALTAIPWFFALYVITAFGGKLIGAGGGARLIGLTRREAVATGVGMSARATVELVIADIALRAGLFEQPEPTPAVVGALFSAVVLMAILSTIVTPLWLRWLIR